jgi:hypothetical protein
MREKTNLFFRNAHFRNLEIQVHRMHQHRGDCVIKETTDFAPWQVFLQQCNTVEKRICENVNAWLAIAGTQDEVFYHKSIW